MQIHIDTSKESDFSPKTDQAAEPGRCPLGIYGPIIRKALLEVPSISFDVVAAARRSDSALAAADEKAIRTAGLRYRKFLGLAAKFPDVELSPTRDIDEVWHLHMLQPRAYVQDCNRIFGLILDHDGGFGKDSDLQYQDLLDVFDRTAALWRSEYAEPYLTTGPTDIVRCIIACRKACKKK